MNLLVWIALVAIILTIAVRLWIMSQVRVACRRGAEKIYHDLVQVFSGEHVYRVSRADDFPELEEAEYQALETLARERGFVCVGSIEDLTVSEATPAHRTRIDCYLSSDGATTLTTYRLREMQIYDILSGFQGERFLATTNAEANKLDAPPGTERTTLPLTTPPAELLSIHAKSLERYRAAHPAASIVLHRTLDDVMRSARLFTSIVSVHRRSIGFLTEKELKLLGEGKSPEQILAIVWQEFEKVREEKRAA